MSVRGMPPMILATAEQMAREQWFTAIWYDEEADAWCLFASRDAQALDMHLISHKGPPTLSWVYHNPGRQMLQVVPDQIETDQRALATYPDLDDYIAGHTNGDSQRICEMCQDRPATILDSGNAWCSRCYLLATGDIPSVDAVNTEKLDDEIARASAQIITDESGHVARGEGRERPVGDEDE